MSKRHPTVGDRVKETTVSGSVRMHTISTMYATVKYPKAGERYIGLVEDDGKTRWTLPYSTLMGADWLEVLE